MNAAIVFEPDGYLRNGPQLMGRQVAGHGFLRAAVACRDGQPLIGVTPNPRSAEAFRRAVLEVDANAQAACISPARQDALRAIGTVYRPDPYLAGLARQRLRVGVGAYSLCGVTHTVSTSGTLAALASLAIEPVAPWDAIVCTSSATKSVVETILEHGNDYLAWRSGHRPSDALPLLPVIPLGVHCADFEISSGDRLQARAALGLAEDEVAVLFAGRFSVAGKAHPYATFSALQAAQAETGRKIVLILGGYAYNAVTEGHFLSGLSDFCPDVRTVMIDGREPAPYRQAWAGADIFVSLADSIQESFGITPLEAMAAGLPALVSDWNGYRDTVRDGVDGFRIRTWAPAPGAGVHMAQEFEFGSLDYDQYLSRSNTAIVVDLGQLGARLRALVEDVDLRRRMGEAGRQRAREVFDWPTVFRRYQALWDELGAVRTRALKEPQTLDWLNRAPRATPSHLSPFEIFASFPSVHIDAATIVAPGINGDLSAYRGIVSCGLTKIWALPEPLVSTALAALEAGPQPTQKLAEATGLPIEQATELVARLAKLGVLTLARAEAETDAPEPPAPTP